MPKLALIGLGLIAVPMAFTPVAAETPPTPTIVIKIATLAPSGSPYHEIMQEMAAGWREQSDGRVELRIYPGGVAGDEVDILRKIRIGQLDAGALSLSGLSRTLPEISVLGTPMIFKTREDLLQVQDALDSKIEERMEEKGFVVISWAIAGWVRFFVPEAEPSIAGLKKARMHVFAGDDQIMELWKTMGFNAIALPGTDVLPGLQSGMVNAFFTTPVMAYASQWVVCLHTLHDRYALGADDGGDCRQQARLGKGAGSVATQNESDCGGKKPSSGSGDATPGIGSHL